MKILKKNQIIIFVIAFMLITAGYLNYTTGDKKDFLATSSLMDSEEVAGIGDAKLVSSNNVVEQENKVSESTEQKNNVEDKQTSGEIVENEEDDTIQEVSSKPESQDGYFTSSRLGRDTMYSQMIESYEKILQNETISSEQKAIAQTEIKKINDLKNSIMITENLIKTKGFEDVVIFVNDTSVNVIIKAEKLEQEQTAQIQNIITRELKVDINNVHISNK